MSAITFENNQFIFVDDSNNQHILISSEDFENNCSSQPTCIQTQSGQTVNSVYPNILRYNDEFKKMSEEEKTNLSEMSVMLPLLLVTRELMKKNRSIKVLEIGADNGAMSYFLAKLLKRYHSNNKLVCVVESLQKRWLDRISLSNAGEIVSLLRAEYTEPFLQKDFFDIVVVNGSVQFEEPAQVLYNAVNCTKNNGLLICISESRYLLTSCLQMAVDGCKQYDLSPVSSILAKTLTQQDKRFSQEKTKEFALAAYKKSICDAVGSVKAGIKNLTETGYLNGANNPAVDESIKAIAQAENEISMIYTELGSLDIKFDINALKEALIDYRLSDSEDTRKGCAKQCGKKLATLVKEMRRFSDFE